MNRPRRSSALMVLGYLSQLLEDPGDRRVHAIFPLLPIAHERIRLARELPQREAHRTEVASEGGACAIESLHDLAHRVARWPQGDLAERPAGPLSDRGPQKHQIDWRPSRPVAGRWVHEWWRLVDAKHAEEAIEGPSVILRRIVILLRAPERRA